MDALRPPHLPRIFRRPTLPKLLRPAYFRQSASLAQQQQPEQQERRPRDPVVGTTTPVPDETVPSTSRSSFYFEAGYALFAKRPSRPFPPPFLSPPSGSFSDPLSTYDRSRDRRRTSYVNGEMIRGITNGDDAVLVSENFVGANDGVGAWGERERGHAALWSRLILHFWALEAERDAYGGSAEPDPVRYLQRALDQTAEVTSKPNEWLGTTTACSALLHSSPRSLAHPLLYVTQLGDSQIMVVRPKDKKVIYKTEEQWHWFDCPRQLGTNSPDTPKQNAVMDKVPIEENDVVLAMSDGVCDNLWEHEVVENVLDSMNKWEQGDEKAGMVAGESTYADGMRFVAQELVKAARQIAEDPFAESPFMERSIEEGIPTEGATILFFISSPPADLSDTADGLWRISLKIDA
ncbi:MAG: hypothetical protein M1820_002747 [Bogoriella megaspora]|nr:MAG: hypothetical protein M1820_002747 [Bogoriella megaspora]